jgi:hypothetical protein
MHPTLKEVTRMSPIAEKLAALGIVITPKTPWRRMEDSTEPVIFVSGRVCWCAGRPRYVTSTPIEHNGRRIIVNQCPDCRGEIAWHYWRIDGKWTGPTDIRIEETSCATPCAFASKLPPPA